MPGVAKSRAKTLVVIDANYFFRDPDLDHATWADLTSLQGAGLIDICVPEVVVGETQRHQGDELTQGAGAVLSGVRDAHDLLEKLGVKVAALDVASVREQLTDLQEARSIEKPFRKKLLECGVRILEMPEILVTDMWDDYLGDCCRLA